MCGIANILNLSSQPVQGLEQRLQIMNNLQRHRGPDGQGLWTHNNKHIGFGHRRLSIIDLETGSQPMHDENGNWITYNGEIYNYIELRKEIGETAFTTTSDTEVILRSYNKWGEDCVNHLRGMFSFAIWDEKKELLFIARDRFGIKPLYYMTAQNVFYAASEIKALLPFVDSIETDIEGFEDYLAFQFCLDGKTLFSGIRELPAGHYLRIHKGNISVRRYWEVYYNIDFTHNAQYFEEAIHALLTDSVKMHMRSDVPVGAYLSGGLDSSAITSLASKVSADAKQEQFKAFTGKFSMGSEYDESRYAKILADANDCSLHVKDITSADFINNIQSVIYHMDSPAAGPGSFPQYMVSQMASEHRKVVLGGQGGDEIFGGYTRYLIAYFEQCIKAAIDGTINNGHFVVTYESIIPNLRSLRNYKPMIKEFWKEDLFESMDKRYFRLINRTNSLTDEVNWSALSDYCPFETFQNVFHGDNVGKESYFDLMTHFDFKTLLPALLQVEDRVSMAHGLESRVPLLDHPLVELAATIPADIKFENGDLKHVFKNAIKSVLPKEITERKDKMGFPTPLTEWMKGDARNFICDIFSTNKALNRELIDNSKVAGRLDKEHKFDRKMWGLLCMELWQQEFHDKESQFKSLAKDL